MRNKFWECPIKYCKFKTPSSKLLHTHLKNHLFEEIVGELKRRTPQTMRLRQISDKQAEKEIIQVFKKSNRKKHYWESDFIDKLCLDFDQIRRVIKHLEAQGKVIPVNAHGVR